MTNTRILTDWLQSYEIHTKNILGAASFHTWSALTILGAAATGRVQIFEEPNAIYSNLMTILVGFPSAGKSVAANTAKSIFNTACQSQSNMQIYDCDGTLKDIVQEVTATPSTSSYTVFSGEANIIFNNAKHLQIARTIKLYNSGRISLLTGVQADLFKYVFPKHLFDLSLLPRTHFVIADKTPMPKVFQHDDLNPDLRSELEHDLKIIMRLSGEITFSKKARDLINHWWVDELGADLSQLEHPMLAQYNEKRIIHLLKLAMICSMSRTNSLVVIKKDVTRAFKIMTDNEKLLAVHADQILPSNVDIEVLCQIRKLMDLTKTPVPRHVLVRVISQLVPADQVTTTVKNLKDQRMITELRRKGTPGLRFYILGPAMELGCDVGQLCALSKLTD